MNNEYSKVEEAIMNSENCANNQGWHHSHTSYSQYFE
jgi:hypothetical protein